MDTQPVQNQSGWRLAKDTGVAVGSLFIPGLPAVTAISAAQDVAQGKQDLFQASPRLIYGMLATLPSVASAAFLPSFWKPLEKVVLHPLFAKTYNYLIRPQITYPLLALSVLSLGWNILKNEDIEDVAGTALIVGATFFMVGFRRPPKVRWEIGNGFIFLRPRKGAYRGGLFEKIMGLRHLLLYSAPRALWGFNPKNNGYGIATLIQMENDLHMLHRTGVVMVRTLHMKYLSNSARRANAFVVQHVHWNLSDWSLVDVVARNAYFDLGQFMKGDLTRVGMFRIASGRDVGYRGIVADRNFAESARRMREAFCLHYSYRHREGGVFLEYATWTRTSKNALRATHGPDVPTRLWKPHWEPYARAIEYGHRYDDRFEVVPSVIRYFPHGGNPLHTAEVEFFPGVPVRPYVEKMREGLSLEDTAKQMRDNQVKWLRSLVERDSYFTEYVDEYYRFHRGGVPIAGH